MKNLLMTLVLVVCFGAMAQTAKPSEADYGVAYKLFEIMNMEQQMKNNTKTVMDLQLSRNPQLAPYRQEMETFMNKYISYNAIKKDIADIYLKNFSVDDLKELAKFYQSPLGKKFLSKNEAITRESMQLGMNKVQANIAELQQMIISKQSSAAK